MPGKHATLSPSSSSRWLQCVGAPAMELPFPNTSSTFSDEGTAAHAVGERALVYEKPASHFIGESIIVSGEGEPVRSVVVTEEMAEYVQVYVDNVLARVDMYYKAGAIDVQLLVEQRLPIGHITGEEGAEGTGDALLLVTFADGTGLIDVNDLKYVRGVLVEAEKNPQMSMYALGALELYGALGDFTRFVYVIHQPRIQRAPSEWECSLQELEEFKALAMNRAGEALNVLTSVNNGQSVNLLSLVPSKKGCKFCKAKATCPALRHQVLATVADDFVNVEEPASIAVKLEPAVERIKSADNQIIANLLPHLDMIEDWCNALRQHAHDELLAGRTVPGYKLVQGKTGNRAWGDESAVEAAMKSMRLKQEEMYQFKLISPTAAEKLLKDNPRRWAKLETLITRAPGKPTLAPESDKRPAITLADDFNDVSNTAEDLV